MKATAVAHKGKRERELTYAEYLAKYDPENRCGDSERKDVDDADAVGTELANKSLAILRAALAEA
jgi:hypothetical protein